MGPGGRARPGGRLGAGDQHRWRPISAVRRLQMQACRPDPG